MQVYQNGSFSSVSTNNVGSNSIIQQDMGSRHLDVVYASQSVNYYNVTGHNNGDIYFDPTYYDPIITTDTNSILNFSFANLTINAFNQPSDDYYEIRYFYPNQDTYYTANIDNFKSTSNGNLFFTIPKSFFTDNIVVRDGARIAFDLLKYHRQEPAVTLETFNLGGYTLSLTTQEQQEINEDSDKQVLSDIKQEQQQTTQAVQNLENTITDSNIDDDIINLPTDNTDFVTEDGIDNIFNAIYEAFITGEPQNITLPIPYTNNNIVIDPQYTYNMLHNNNGDILINIIKAFYWYIICKWIVLDITDKIILIKQGEFEEIQNLNIKEDML